MLFPLGPAFQGSTSSSEFHFPLAFDEEKAAALLSLEASKEEAAASL